MELNISSSLHGFTVEDIQDLHEIDGTAYVMRHTQTGARLLYLANDDNDKSFSIGFKTPPVNDTGVFHILEHSVLNGSVKFPVKEPFVNLLKSSMQTFLNAMTFPDKTLYPVASTNEKDLMNMMDVYLDAVLNPLIYERPCIFKQEGWHYELESTDAPLVRNGVVYNEMKGVYSDPEALLYNELSRALYPDTAYGYESGGDPKHIGELSYEQFLQEHRNHYRLDNSYITLYGNLNIDTVLAFLDEHLCAFKGNGDGQPNPLELQPPVENLNITTTMQTSPDNACVGLGLVLGTVDDRERIAAASIVLDALMGSNEAPLKKLLLEADLGGEVSHMVDESRLQPMVMISLKNARKDVKDSFLTTLEEGVKHILAEGIDQKLLEGSIAHTEFWLREQDFGFSNGVMLAIMALSSWLYDDEAVIDGLCYEELFASLRNKLGTGYYEDVLADMFLHNSHRALAEVVPTEAEENWEQIELAQVKRGLSQADCEQIQEEHEKLRAFQAIVDSPEDIATLPLLSLDDIAESPTEPELKVETEYCLPLLRHDIPSHGISYLSYYFNLQNLRYEDLPYVSLLVSTLGKLDTAQHSAAEIDTLTQLYLGKLSFSTSAASSYEGDAIVPLMCVEVSALEEHLDVAVALPQEIWSQTNFADPAKIKAILTQRKIMLEQFFAASGNAAANSRMRSYTQKTGVFAEAVQGVDFYRFLCDLLDNFDDRIDDLQEKLQDLSTRVFTTQVTVSYTGNPDLIEQVFELGGDFGLKPCPQTEEKLSLPEPVAKNEGFIIPGDVSYVGSCLLRDMSDEGKGFHGSWLLVNRLLSYDYLWNEVRVKGGAYGCHFKAQRAGLLLFDSYRDPNVDATVERFAGTGAWLAHYEPSEAEMTGYVIASTAAFDAPRKPAALAARQDLAYLCNYPASYRQEIRQEIVQTDLDQVHKLAQAFDSFDEKRSVCVFGCAKSLQDTKLAIDVEKLF